MSSANLLCDYQPAWKIESYPALRHPLRSEVCEAQVLVSDGNVHQLPTITPESIHKLFEDYCDSIDAQSVGEKIALDYGTEQISYMALDVLSNKVAKFLIDEGVQTGDRIGLLLDRSAFAYASILGVLKAGAAFVPLDKSFPPDRLQFILEDCDASLLLTVNALAGAIPVVCKRTIVLDNEESKISKLRGDRVSRVITADALAYVIYTSGSTGRPKGVPITHASICNFLEVAIATYGYVESDRVYQGLTFAFDFSFEEIWLPLLIGATLVPAPSDISLVGDDLAEFLQMHKVTALCCTPTLLSTITTELPMLRFIMVSGEACPQPLAQRWASTNRRMLNTYGPTEATVTATWQVMSERGTVSIGGPLPSYSVVILSPDRLIALPHGEVGEIALAGVGLAKGYINLPEKTDSVFVNDFIGLPDNPGRKLYRTGDLGRINSGCTIEYLGRIDTQVKIRGYRIELEEIESVAMSVDGVLQAVTSPVDMPGGDKELVLFISCRDKKNDETLKNLGDTLSDRMPVYMVPRFIEEIEEFPVLPSGKVDRKSLPAPKLQRQQSVDCSYREPAPGMESRLAEQISEHLRIERVSASADFFSDLGANSLLLAQLVSSINKKIPEAGVTLKKVYQNPSIEKLAHVLDPQANALSPNSMQYQESPVDRLSPHRVSNLRYVTYSVIQISAIIVLGLLGTMVLVFGLHWLSGVETLASKYKIAFAYTNTMFIIAILFFWGLKWLVMGKCDDTPIPLWTVKHFRSWLAGIAIAGNPLNAFTGLPLYAIYLRMIGVRVGKNTTIMTGAPRFPDLVSVGSNTMLRETVYIGAHTVRNGYIIPGRISIGDNVYVAPSNILDAGSTLENDIQLGNNSVVCRNQVLHAGKNYQGSPAEEVNTNFIKCDESSFGAWRRWIFTALLIIPGIFLTPLGFLLIDFIAPRSAMLLPYLTASNAGWLLIASVVVYFFSIFLSCLSVTIFPRIVAYIVKTHKSSPLFGVQYVFSSWMAGFSNSKSLNRIFGDSSLIVYYFKAIGYGMRGVVQTGSNAGVEQKHNSPFLCSFSRNAMVADGLTMKNIDVSHTNFRLREINIPEDTYLGNDIFYPTEAKIGKNCLVATKAMVPIDGPIRSGIGILGSPPFEIPRSVESDRQFSQYKDPDLLKSRLHQKLISNLCTLGLYFVKTCTQLFLLSLFLVLLFKIGSSEELVG